MKKFIFTLTFIALVASPVFSQSQDGIDKLENFENQSEDKNANSLFEYKEDNDVIEITLGKRIFIIDESNDKTRISIEKKETYKKTQQKNVSKFRGHLGGFGIGYNNFMTDFWETSLKPGDEYFDINSSSKAWSIMFSGVNIEFTRHFGITSGIGLTLNGYRFNGNNSITRGENGVIVPVYPAYGIEYKKSKLNTAYVNIPVVLELQIPTNGSHRKTVNIGGGVVGAAKLWSKTKMVWNDGGRRKSKENSDFSLNVLRWGTTARVGYGSFQIYGTTYHTPMFQRGKGPKLYPYEAGVAFTF